MDKPIRAKLVRIDVPNDWYDLHKDSTFVYLVDGREELVNASDVPIDCRTIGQEVELRYEYFSIGDTEGYKYIPYAVNHEPI